MRTLHTKDSLYYTICIDPHRHIHYWSNLDKLSLQENRLLGKFHIYQIQGRFHMTHGT